MALSVSEKRRVGASLRKAKRYRWDHHGAGTLRGDYAYMAKLVVRLSREVEDLEAKQPQRWSDRRNDRAFREA